MFDNYDLYSRHEAEQCSRLSRLPICSECGEPIQDEICYKFGFDLICPDCLYEGHRVFTENEER